MTPRRKPRRRWQIPACVAALVVCALRGAPAQEISFNRDVRPILSDRCFACHGPDRRARKARLRLDRATGGSGAYRTRGESTAIKPGSLAESEVWKRITTSDPDEVMPPPDAEVQPRPGQLGQLPGQRLEGVR